MKTQSQKHYEALLTKAQAEHRCTRAAAVKIVDRDAPKARLRMLADANRGRGPAVEGPIAQELSRLRADD